MGPVLVLLGWRWGGDWQEGMGWDGRRLMDSESGGLMGGR
jgi:hypothetical protein